MRAIAIRCYEAKQESLETGLTVIKGKEFPLDNPDYEPETIEQKLIPQGSD